MAWRRKIKSPAVPKAAQYAMRIFIGAGTEIPQFTDVANFGKNKKMSVTPYPYPSRPRPPFSSLPASLASLPRSRQCVIFPRRPMRIGDSHIARRVGLSLSIVMFTAAAEGTRRFGGN